MEKLSRDKLWSLEQYSQERPAFRRSIIEHKKLRRVALGEHVVLIFEDFLTMKYQVQEMLRVEKLFESQEIDEEIGAYNPLIPDGDNWKATLQIEYADEDARRDALNRMVGIEHKVWFTIGGSDRVFAIANEDLERSTDTKTAAVHFLRFQLTPELVTAVKRGENITIGIDHPELPYELNLAKNIRDSLAGDIG